jgi:hypothetical protein
LGQNDASASTSCGKIFSEKNRKKVLTKEKWRGIINERQREGPPKRPAQGAAKPLAEPIGEDFNDMTRTSQEVR